MKLPNGEIIRLCNWQKIVICLIWCNHKVLVIKLPNGEIVRLCNKQKFVICLIWCNLEIWVINHKYSKRFLSIRKYFQAFKKFFKHIHVISCYERLVWYIVDDKRELQGMSRDLDGKCWELANSQWANRYFAGCRRIFEGSRCEKLQHQKSHC